MKQTAANDGNDSNGGATTNATAQPTGVLASTGVSTAVLLAAIAGLCAMAYGVKVFAQYKRETQGK
ncbi:hypothetical protein [Bifidobacterium cebidarum]|uniref:Uncharacterized protein n=1 Tax=Bifidobacterium cebidarum TaxID=2650773 RepID=A0A6I1G8I0_9BIFI|nr:hypothetical protein [Bifidobacterium cebidarum]KAB7787386.1 hypothetical protein F7D08_1561 [Bifidobacterium cebidarum]